jgi:hypothetical protein
MSMEAAPSSPKRSPKTGATKAATEARTPSQGAKAAQAGVPRRRRKTTANSQHLRGKDPFVPAVEAAVDLLMTALAGQRVHDACQGVAYSRPEQSRIDVGLWWHFKSVRTIEQFRANFTPEELKGLASDLEHSVKEKARTILDGIGNQAHSHAVRERYLILMRGLANQLKIPCALEELECKLAEKSAEIGRQASIMDLGPPQLAYPSKKRFRYVVAGILGVDERSVRRWEQEGDNEYDPRIFKSKNDRIEEDPNKARLAKSILENLASLAGK